MTKPDIEAVKARLVYALETKKSWRIYPDDLAALLARCAELDQEQQHSLSVIAESYARAELAEQRLAAAAVALRAADRDLDVAGYHERSNVRSLIRALLPPADGGEHG